VRTLVPRVAQLDRSTREENMPEYQFQFDESFLIEAFRKYRRQHGARYASLAVSAGIKEV